MTLLVIWCPLVTGCCLRSWVRTDAAVDHYARGQFLADAGDLDAALSELAKAIRDDPELSVAHAAIGYHAEPSTFAVGAVSSLACAVLAMWLATGRQLRRPARELLEADFSQETVAAPGAAVGRRGLVFAAVAALAAAATAGYGHPRWSDFALQPSGHTQSGQDRHSQADESGKTVPGAHALQWGQEPA